MINEYFDLLEDWKKLPAYKLETRIDSFIGYSLPPVIEHILGLNTVIIIPELPIRLGTVHPKHNDKHFANRSYKVDFYIRTEDKQNIFIEFKSDSRSRREKQDRYLKLASEVKMKAILEGIIQIFKVTSYKYKYIELLKKLQEAGLIKQLKGEYFPLVSSCCGKAKTQVFAPSIS